MTALLSAVEFRHRTQTHYAYRTTGSDRGHRRLLQRPVKEGFDAGIRSEEMAVQITSDVVSNQIEKATSQEQRDLVLDQLGRLNETRGTRQQDPLTARIRWIEWMAKGWVENGTITKQRRDYLMSEIIGALAGQTAQERHERRMNNIIHDALIPKLPD